MGGSLFLHKACLLVRNLKTGIAMEDFQMSAIILPLCDYAASMMKRHATLQTCNVVPIFHSFPLFIANCVNDKEGSSDMDFQVHFTPGSRTATCRVGLLVVTVRVTSTVKTVTSSAGNRYLLLSTCKVLRIIDNGPTNSNLVPRQLVHKRGPHIAISSNPFEAAFHQDYRLMLARQPGYRHLPFHSGSEH
jgi:hypothetical protein